jgi:hypothetical protein
MIYTERIEYVEATMKQGVWRAWLEFLARLRARDAAQRQERAHDPNGWRVPYEGDEHNADMTGWKGQGIVEYALVIVLVAIVVIVTVTLIAPIFKKTEPPVMNAPLLEIVRYCEPLARDAHTSTSLVSSNIGNQTVITPQTRTTYTDSADKFIDCMQRYEWQVTR